MDKAGIELATEALNILKGSKAFVADQAPDFMRQVLLCEMIGDFVCIACMVLFTASACAAYWYNAKQEQEGNRDSAAEPLSYILTIIAAAMIVLSIGGAIPELFKIHYAPKVFLMEYFAHLARGK